MRKSIRKYTKEFKQEAVQLALKSPSIVATAKELGIPSAYQLPPYIPRLMTLKSKTNLIVLTKPQARTWQP